MSDPAAVLVTTDVYPPDCGGSGYSTDALVRTLLENGHRVEVLELDPTAAGESRRRYDGVEVVTLGLADHRTPAARIGAREYSFAPVKARVADRLREEPRIDLVHAQHLHSGPGALAAARAAGRAAVLTIRDHWPVCLHGLTWWGGTACPGCTGRNLIGCMHEYYGVARPLAAILIPWARRRLAARAEAPRLAHRAIVPSETLAARLRERLGELPLSVVPNIVDPRRSAELADRASDDPRPDRYLLAAGKLNAGKGFDDLLPRLAAAGAELPIVVAGEGPLQEGLARQARQLGLELVTPGWVDAPRLLSLMRGADALLLPSRVEEALARTMLEALSVGTPVLSWPIGSSREVIEDGVNGWIVESDEVLREALAELSIGEPRERLREGALRTARERFSPGAVYPRVAEVYETALDEAGS